MNKKKLVLQILVVVLIIIVLILVYFMKNPIEKNSSLQNQIDVSHDEEIALDLKSDGNIDVVTISTELDVSSLDIDEYISYGLPIMIDFYGTTCPPCKAMEEDIKKFHQDTLGKVTVRQLDAWKYPAEASGYPVMVVPTQIFLTSDGKPYMPSEEVYKKVPLSLYSWKDTEELAFTTHQGMLTYEEMKIIFDDMGVVL